MGLYDRDYTQEGFHPRHQYAQRMRMGFPSITPMVKRLLIINVSVYLAAVIISPLGVLMYEWGEIDTTSWLRSLQLWRLVTYQFLHSPADIFHIIFNMLGLYFLGPTLERHWGSRKFLKFYLGCGAAGGLFYILLASVGFLARGAMVGASGAILGLLAACAILFPQFVVFFFLFPVPIRIAAVILTVIYVASIFRGAPNAGGDAAHLAGMATGAAYVLSGSWRYKLKGKFQTDPLQRKIAEQKALQAEVDRILEKVHNHGIKSLTLKEKRTLKRATKLQQMQNRL